MRALVGHIAQNRNLLASRIRFRDDSLYPLAEIYFTILERRIIYLLAACSS
jgi:hypothetical protein